MEAPFNLEDKVWKTIKGNDLEGIKRYFTKTTTVLSNGKRLEGETFAEQLCEKNIYFYTIELFEVVACENIDEESTFSQNMYMTRLTSSKESKQRMLSITTTWKRSETENNLLAAMIHEV